MDWANTTARGDKKDDEVLGFDATYTRDFMVVSA